MSEGNGYPAARAQQVGVIKPLEMCAFTPRLMPELLPELEEILVYLADSTEYFPRLPKELPYHPFNFLFSAAGQDEKPQALSLLAGKGLNVLAAGYESLAPGCGSSPKSADRVGSGRGERCWCRGRSG